MSAIAAPKTEKFGFATSAQLSAIFATTATSAERTAYLGFFILVRQAERVCEQARKTVPTLRSRTRRIIKLFSSKERALKRILTIGEASKNAKADPKRESKKVKKRE